jgi:hypothetical protein
MNLRIHFCLFALLLPLGAAAAAPSPVSNGEFTPLPNACKSEVAKFEETIGFIRQHQGNAAASALREKLLPAKVEAELLASQGYCGLANYLREKKLNR